jgi:ligand-binding sensor domain-containing protein/signal transduction histidine kinase
MVVLLFILAYVALVDTTTAHAQTTPRFERLSLEQGLPQSSVLAVLQDRKGFLWCGTQDGLARYDGYGFTVFRKNSRQPHSLKGHWVQALHEDQRGTLWIGTLDGGLHCFDPTTQRFTAFPYINSQDSTNSASVAIRSLYEDTSSATLWCGTNGAGLLLFDMTTRRFTHEYKANASRTNTSYTAQSSQSFQSLQHTSQYLPGNGIRAFYKDTRGNIWIATNAGLAKYDRSSKQFTTYAYQYEEYKKHDKQRERSAQQAGINNLWSLCEDTPNVLWVGTLNGELLRFDCLQERWLSYPQQAQVRECMAGAMIDDIMKDAQGALWIASQGRGLVMMRPTGAIIHCLNTSYNPTSLSSNNVTTLRQDRSGIVWVGTSGGGLNKWNPHAQHFALYQHSDASKDGLDANFGANLSANLISAIAADKTGTIWIGTEAGLNELHPATGRITVHRHDPRNPHSLSSNSVSTLAVDSLGTVWVGTSGGGLNMFHRATRRFSVVVSDEQHPEKSVWGKWVSHLYVDRRGDLWIVNNSVALQRLRPADMTVTHGHYREVFGRRPPLALLEDGTGTWWIGTLGNGVFSFAPTLAPKRYMNTNDNDHSIRDNTTSALYEDSRGWLWVGTGAGLDVFDRTRGLFYHIHESRNDALQHTFNEPINNAHTDNSSTYEGLIYAIVEDTQGRIWFSDNNGLAMVTIDRAQATHQMSNTSRSIQDMRYTIQRFDMSDGLQSKEFNQYAACKAPDGHLYFGGINGFNAFHPDSIRRNIQPPPVAITEFKTLRTPQGFDTSAIEAAIITLPHTENSFTIGFTALDFSNPQKNLYAYKLDGFDRDWIYTTAQERFARYTNLDGGKYVFHVKAANNHGLWNTAGRTLVIVIHPPFWRTRWFYTLTVVLAVVVVLSLYRWRLARELRRAEEMEQMRVQENNRVRKKAADDFHDEFGHKLTKIALLSEVIKHNLAEIETEEAERNAKAVQADATAYPLVGLSFQSSLDKIIDTAKELSTGMRDFLWTLNPDKDSLYEIAIRLKDFGDDFFDTTDIAFRVVGVTHTLERVRISMDERRHITLLFKEAMNNILKHAECRTVTLEVTTEANAVTIALRDDGKGFALNGAYDKMYDRMYEMQQDASHHVMTSSTTQNNAPQNNATQSEALQNGSAHHTSAHSPFTQAQLTVQSTAQATARFTAANGHSELGQGLLSMHERAHKVNGTLSIRSTVGGGTTVTFCKRLETDAMTRTG